MTYKDLYDKFNSVSKVEFFEDIIPNYFINMKDRKNQINIFLKTYKDVLDAYKLYPNSIEKQEYDKNNKEQHEKHLYKEFNKKQNAKNKLDKLTNYNKESFNKRK